MTDLKLIALDSEDLAVISAHLQDAVLKIGDMAYLPRERRFVAVANRFDWSSATGADGAERSQRNDLIRRQSGLRFERVISAKVQGLDLTKKNEVVSVLAVRFEETTAPGGHVTLVLAGGGAVRLEVECIEAELKDLGAAWRTKRMPRHALAEDAAEKK